MLGIVYRSVLENCNMIIVEFVFVLFFQDIPSLQLAYYSFYIFVVSLEANELFPKLTSDFLPFHQALENLLVASDIE